MDIRITNPRVVKLNDKIDLQLDLHVDTIYIVIFLFTSASGLNHLGEDCSDQGASKL